jgi:hypothetical protein
MLAMSATTKTERLHPNCIAPERSWRLGIRHVTTAIAALGGEV